MAVLFFSLLLLIKLVECWAKDSCEKKWQTVLSTEYTLPHGLSHQWSMNIGISTSSFSFTKSSKQSFISVAGTWKKKLKPWQPQNPVSGLMTTTQHSEFSFGLNWFNWTALLVFVALICTPRPHIFSSSWSSHWYNLSSSLSQFGPLPYVNNTTRPFGSYMHYALLS